MYISSVLSAPLFPSPWIFLFLFFFSFVIQQLILGGNRAENSIGSLDRQERSRFYSKSIGRRRIIINERKFAALRKLDRREILGESVSRGLIKPELFYIERKPLALNRVDR